MGNSLIVREPVGVVGCITPWNYPLHQIAAKVAAGAGGRLHRRAEAERGGAAQRVHPRRDHPRRRPARGRVQPRDRRRARRRRGDRRAPATSTWCRSPDRPVPASASPSSVPRRSSGSRSSSAASRANVILDDADLATAVADGVAKAYLNSGQTCSALTRMLVPPARMAEVEELAGDGGRDVQMGDPFDDGTTPRSARRRPTQRERVRGYIQKGVDEGATLVTGGAGAPEGLDKGFYVQPTVFSDVKPDMTIAQEEIFGPVLSIIPYDTEEEAVADRQRHGLRPRRRRVVGRQGARRARGAAHAHRAGRGQRRSVQPDRARSAATSSRASVASSASTASRSSSK